MKKLYYIVKGVAGCFGSLSTCKRLPENYKNKKECEKKRRELNKNKSKNEIYFIEFLWSEL